jgi:DNA helicase-2/ATP-dependent DNA helicase PcrA
MRQADLTQLVQIASTYPARERFLTELTRDPLDATSDEARGPLLDEDYLILSTIHSSQGSGMAVGLYSQRDRRLYTL